LSPLFNALLVLPQEEPKKPEPLSKELRGCVKTLKETMLGGVALIDNDRTDFDDKAEKVNAFAKNSRLVESHFNRYYINSAIPTSLSVFYVLEDLDPKSRGTTKISSELEIKKEIDTNKNNLYLKVEWARFEANREQVSLKQKYRVTEQCGLVLVEGSEISTDTIKSEIVKSRRTFVPGAASSLEIKRFPIELAEKYDQGRRIFESIDKLGKIAEGHQEFDTVIDFDLPPLHFVWDKVGELSRVDSFSGKNEIFDHFKLVGQQGKLPILSFDFFKSRVSQYAEGTMQFSAAPQMRATTENVPIAIWKNSDLGVNSYGPSSDVTVVGFKKGDFEKDLVPVRIKSNIAWGNYENLGAYGTLTNETKNPGSFEYIFLSGQTDPKMKARVKKEFYLKPTKYYDYQSREIQDLIEEVRALKPTDPRARAEAVLNVLHRHFKADENLLYDSHLNRSLTASQSARIKSGICKHFSTLYIAMARGMGIPARAVYGYHTNSEAATAHMWVEISLNGESWLPIEPQLKTLSLWDRGYLPISTYPAFETDQTETFDLTAPQSELNLKWVISPK
jgi:transglutaminase-like putative cysteine protease